MSHAEKVREVLRGLVRRAGEAVPEGLRHQKAGQTLPAEAPRGRSGKKSPALGTVGAACRIWAKTHHAKNLRTCARDLAALCGNIPAGRLGAAHIEAITESWYARGYAKATKHSYSCGLRKLMGLLGRADLAAEVKILPEGPARTTIATPDDIARAIAQAMPWLRAAILIANHAALRAGDCLRLSEAHINREAQTITIKQEKAQRNVTVPLTEELAACFDAAPPSDDQLTPVVARYAGKPVSYSMLNQAWNKLRKRAGLTPDLHMHDLRRTTAVGLYEVSKDLRIVQQMLGHASLTSTIRYLEHRDPTKLAPLLQALWTPKGPVQ